MEKTKKKHRKKTRKTLKKLLTIGLRIKFSKSKFKKEEVKFLRHIIGRGDIKSNPEKIKILKE